MYALEWIILRWTEDSAGLTGWGFLMGLWIFAAWCGHRG